MSRMRTRITRTALVATAVAALGVTAGMGTASAAPSTWLPDALLFCGSTTVHPDEWVAVPPSDTFWVTSGPLTGHYVILSDAHYIAPGYLTAPPSSYDGLSQVGSRTWGAKQGLARTAMTCDFVSRWGEPGDPDTFSVVGPITMARVPG